MKTVPRRKSARVPAPTNQDAARALEELALRAAMEDGSFRSRAFERAAEGIGRADRSLAELAAEGGERALRTIPGVGEGIAERLTELFRTGHIAELDALRREHPVDVAALCAIEGLGPKTVAVLEHALDIRTLADLRSALERGRVAAIPGFGQKKQARLRASLELWESVHARAPLAVARATAVPILARLRAAEGVALAELAGSARRGRETIGDLDFVVAARPGSGAAEAFASAPEVDVVLARGETQVRVRLARGGPAGRGIDADLRVVLPESFGAALVYFTGSKAHNIALRAIAQKRGLKLNEYGLYRGRRVVASRDERDVYAALGLDFVPPELREDAGEIDAASQHRLPALVEPDDVRFDVHAHLPPERATLEAAHRAGLETLVLVPPRTAKLRAHAAAVRALGSIDGVRALAGAEVEIDADGELALPDDALDALDFVGGAVYASLDLDRHAMTERIVRAIESEKLDVLYHPFARRLGHRRPIELDFAAVLDAARRTGTALELDAHPERMDLDAAHVREAIGAGVRVAIGSSALDAAGLAAVRETGVTLARRGWARARDLWARFETGRRGR